MKYPLVKNNLTPNDKEAAIQVINSGWITMGQKVSEFESKFARMVDSKYALMTNSGSSANLLMVASLTASFFGQPTLKRGSRIAVPAVCWSTSLWPIWQLGYVPVMIDCDPSTLNVDLTHLKRCHDKFKFKAFMAVHTLGNSCDMFELIRFCEEKDIILLEDTCEALGSKLEDRSLGTLGLMGSYSFYFSHHMTTIEGGMVVTECEHTYQTLISMRSHGWVRNTSFEQSFAEAYPDIDPRFGFILPGFNLRPMELQAAIGLEQLSNLQQSNKIRIQNFDLLAENLTGLNISTPQVPAKHNPAWFGFPFLTTKKHSRQAVAKRLLEHSIDSRPIIAGNIINQPAMKCIDYIVDDQSGYQGAEEISAKGWFIGVHNTPLKFDDIAYLREALEFALQ